MKSGLNHYVYHKPNSQVSISINAWTVPRWWVTWVLEVYSATLMSCSHLQLLKIWVQVQVILSSGFFSPCYLDYGMVWGMDVHDKEK